MCEFHLRAKRAQSSFVATRESSYICVELRTCASQLGPGYAQFRLSPVPLTQAGCEQHGVYFSWRTQRNLSLCRERRLFFPFSFPLSYIFIPLPARGARSQQQQRGSSQGMYAYISSVAPECSYASLPLHSRWPHQTRERINLWVPGEMQYVTLKHSFQETPHDAELT